MKEKESLDLGTQSRYDLSYYSFRQLQRDYMRFERAFSDKFPNEFICRILINYMCYAQDIDCGKFEKEISELMSKKTHYENYGESRRITFTADLVSKLSGFDFAEETCFKKRVFITYILDKYSYLQISEREKIYSYSQFKTINEAIANNKMLIITMYDKAKSPKQQEKISTYEVKPYILEIDENSLSYYLVGYSKPRNTDNDYGCYSFKLCRIGKCISTNKEYTLTAKEKKYVKEALSKFGSAYIYDNAGVGQTENIIVRLTERGYRELYLKIIAHQRPIPVSVSDHQTYYDLTFDCSQRQIRNYFFSFGAEAEIISPENLKERFADDYQKALDRYIKKDIF